MTTSRTPFDEEAAKTLFGDAIGLAESLGMRPLIARCHLGLGTLYRRTGQREQAHEHLITATTMYREMGMTELGAAWTREHQTAANVSKLVRLIVADRSRLLRRFARRSWGSLALLSD